MKQNRLCGARLNPKTQCTNKKPTNKKRNSKGSKGKTQQTHLRVFDHAGKVPMFTLPDNKNYQFVQTIDSVFVVQQAAITDTTGSYYFSLSQLAQVTTFQALFDQYRIDEVQVVLRPAYLSQPLTSFTTVRVPLLYVAIDYDDVNTPTISTMREYSNCTQTMYETVVATFQPRIAMAAYSGSFGSFANQGGQWIDMASPSVQHYGIKYACEGGAAGQTSLQVWDGTIRYKFSCRNVR